MARAWLTRIATALLTLAMALSVACAPAPKTTAESLEKGIQADSAGRVDEAIAAYFQVLSLEPKNVFAFYNLGQLYRRSNEIVIAEGYYRQALKVDPAFAPALFGYGFTRLAFADWSAAEDANRKVIAAEPNNAPAHFNLGLALRGQGKEGEAQQAFQRAIQLDRTLVAPAAPSPTVTPRR